MRRQHRARKRRQQALRRPAPVRRRKKGQTRAPVTIPLVDRRVAVLQQDAARAELASDRELANPDLRDNFLRLVGGALLPFIAALRNGEAPTAFAELWVMCRAAAPKRGRRAEVGTAAALALVTAEELRRLYGPMGIFVRRLPDADGVPPPTDPMKWNLELAEDADPDAFEVPFRISVPGRVADATGALHACTTIAAHRLTLPELADALTRVGDHLLRLTQALPPPEPTTRRTRSIFVRGVSAYILKRTGKRMDAITTALYNLIFDTSLSVDTVRRTRARLTPRR